MAKRIPDEELLAELHRLKDELGRIPTHGDMSEKGAYSGDTYYNRFGEWGDVLEVAGLDKPEGRVTSEELIGELQRLGDELESVPMMADMESEGRYGGVTYWRRFGSWNNALREAGIEPNERRNIPEDELTEELRRLQGKLGRAPTTPEIEREGEFSVATHIRRHGTLDAAIRAAGLEPYKYVGSNHPLWRGGGPRTDAVRKSLGNESWDETSRRIRERDGYTCQKCGEQTESAKLNTHHIIPVTSGGCNADELLASLCNSCHRATESRMDRLCPPLLVDWTDDELPKGRERWTPDAEPDRTGQTDLAAFGD